jgi:small redox-active disulfide protein 2
MRFIQILGVGCSKCDMLKKNVEAAVEASGIESLVEKITDAQQIAAFGVTTMPGLAIDGEVKSVGKLLTPEEIQKLIAE